MPCWKQLKWYKKASLRNLKFFSERKEYISNNQLDINLKSLVVEFYLKVIKEILHIANLTSRKIIASVFFLMVGETVSELDQRFSGEVKWLILYAKMGVSFVDEIIGQISF